MKRSALAASSIDHEPGALAFLASFFALFAITQVPLYAIQYIDVADWPNHLARLYVLEHWAQSAALQKYYVLHEFAIAPNLPLEVIVPALSGLVGIELAFKIFVSITVLLFSSGAIALNHAYTGRLQYVALGALLFAYNAMFYFGLLNYLLGLGIAFWLLAAWIHTDRWLPGRRFTLFSAAVVVLYLCHLSALGVYGLGVVGCQLRLVRRRGLRPTLRLDQPAVTFLQFVPAAVLHLLQFKPAGSHIPTVFGASDVAATALHKILFFLLAPGVSVSGYKFGLIAGPILAGLIYIGWRKGTFTFAPKAAAVACLLALAVLLLPRTGYGSAILDGRLLPALVIAIWSGMRVHVRLAQGRSMLVAVTLGVVCTTALTANEWLQRDGDYRRVREAMKLLPESAKVATVVIHKEGNDAAVPISAHVACWSVIDRATFVSNLFAWPFNPVWVGYRDGYAELAASARNTDPGVPIPPYPSIEKLYDYILVVGNDAAGVAGYGVSAKAIYTTPWMRLLRTAH